MNIYPEDSTCDICGGFMAINTTMLADRWTGAQIVHKDPNACRGYLDAERRKLAQDRATFEAERGNV